MTTITLEGKEYQLDIEQAKKLNLFKEKDNKVKSWEEFKEKYENIEGYLYATVSDCILTLDSPINTPIQLTPHEAKALAAFSKLLKLRRDWIGGWEPDWKKLDTKFVIYRSHSNILSVCDCMTTSASLSFPSCKMAKDFLNTFRDLIEEAKILI